MKTTMMMLAALVLSGCLSVQEAHYRKPGETQTLKCDRMQASPALDIWSGLGSLSEGARYADCKTRLEAAGYVRVEKDPAALPADPSVGRVAKYRGPDGQEVWCGFDSSILGLVGAARESCIREAEKQGWTLIK